jgi:ribosomal protein L37AE/L43A
LKDANEYKIMEDTFTCPNCKMDDAYFDGVIFICPNCDHKWETGSGTESKNSASIHKTDSSGYERLIRLNTPFFRLEQGKLYDCKVETDRGIEIISIIPLAFENGKNRQFVIIDARKLFAANPMFVREIVEMDFEYIMNDGIQSNYPLDSEVQTVLCATKSDGTLIDNRESIFFDFRDSIEI